MKVITILLLAVVMCLMVAVDSHAVLQLCDGTNGTFNTNGEVAMSDSAYGGSTTYWAVLPNSVYGDLGTKNYAGWAAYAAALDTYGISDWVIATKAEVDAQLKPATTGAGGEQDLTFGDCNWAQGTPSFGTSNAFVDEFASGDPIEAGAYQIEFEWGDWIYNAWDPSGSLEGAWITSDAAPIPEPASMLMFALAGADMVVRQFRK